MSKQNQDPKPNNLKTGSSFIPYLFIIFFAVIFAVDFTYIYLAKKTWRGLATEDSYQKGIKYNETIELVKKQKQLGWNTEINYRSLSNKNGVLEVILTDKNKKIIRDAIISAKIIRPVQEGYDFTRQLKFDRKNSSYNSVIIFPLQGVWDIEIAVSRGNDYYQDTKRFIIE